MKCTVVGRICDHLGHATERGALYGVAMGHHAIPSAAYLSQQPAQILVDIDHNGQRLGEVHYLERDSTGLWAVAELDDDYMADVPGPIFWSAQAASLSGDRGSTWQGHSAVLQSVALTKEPAQVGARPVTVGHDGHRWNEHERRLVARATEYKRARRSRYEPHRIAEPLELSRLEEVRDTDGQRIAAFYDGKPVQGEPRRSWVTPTVERQRNLTADVEGRVFAATLAVPVEARAKLMLDSDPVGRHAPELDRPGLTVFAATRSNRTGDALAMVADGALSSASPLLTLDGRCTLVSIDR